MKFEEKPSCSNWGGKVGRCAVKRYGGQVIPPVAAEMTVKDGGGTEGVSLMQAPVPTLNANRISDSGIAGGIGVVLVVVRQSSEEGVVFVEDLVDATMIGILIQFGRSEVGRVGSAGSDGPAGRKESFGI